MDQVVDKKCIAQRGLMARLGNRQTLGAVEQLFSSFGQALGTVAYIKYPEKPCHVANSVIQTAQVRSLFSRRFATKFFEGAGIPMRASLRVSHDQELGKSYTGATWARNMFILNQKISGGQINIQSMLDNRRVLLGYKLNVS